MNTTESCTTVGWRANTQNSTITQRELKAQLIQIDEILMQQVKPDAKTEEIINWHRMFTEAVKLHGVDEVLQPFVALLQDILLDTFSFEPLVEECYLASDGGTYNAKTLNLFKAKGHDVQFIPHYVVQQLLKWLRRYVDLPQVSAHDEFYEAALKEAEEEEKRKIRDEKMKRVNARRAEFKKKEPKLDEFAEKIAAAKIDAKNAYNSHHEKMSNFVKEKDAELKAMKLKEQERKESLQKKIGNKKNEEFQQKLEQQGEIQKNLDAEIDELEENVRNLKAKNEQVRGGIRGVDQKCGQVAIIIEEVKKDIKKQKKSWVKQGFITLASIGGCGCATWAIQGMMGSFQGSFTPLNNGAMFNLGYRY